MQVAAELGDEVRIVKVDVDEEQALASHLQARLPATPECQGWPARSVVVLND